MLKSLGNIRRTGEMYWARSMYGGSLRARRSGDRIPVVARYSATIQTCRGTHRTCTMGTGSLSPRVIGQGVALTIHPHLAPRLKNTLSIFPQKMMYNFTGILEDVWRFQKNLPTSSMTKIPLFILRTVPCGHTVTRSKVNKFTY